MRSSAKKAPHGRWAPPPLWGGWEGVFQQALARVEAPPPGASPTSPTRGVQWLSVRYIASPFVAGLMFIERVFVDPRLMVICPSASPRPSRPRRSAGAARRARDSSLAFSKARRFPRPLHRGILISLSISDCCSQTLKAPNLRSLSLEWPSEESNATAGQRAPARHGHRRRARPRRKAPRRLRVRLY